MSVVVVVRRLRSTVYVNCVCVVVVCVCKIWLWLKMKTKIIDNSTRMTMREQSLSPKTITPHFSYNTPLVHSNRSFFWIYIYIYLGYAVCSPLAIESQYFIYLACVCKHHELYISTVNLYYYRNEKNATPPKIVSIYIRAQHVLLFDWFCLIKNINSCHE